MTDARHIVKSADIAAILKDGDGIAEGKNFFHPVRNIDDDSPLLPQFADNAKQIVDLPGGERTGRFIESDDLGIARQRFGNLHHLPLAYREILQRRLRIDIQPQMFQLQAGLIVEQRSVDDTASVR